MEHAATICQRKCSVVLGPVRDVTELLIDGSDSGAVVATDGRNVTSQPLEDRGEGSEGNLAYLEAILNCTGPEGRKFFGRLPCQAFVGEQSLNESIVTINRGQ